MAPQQASRLSVLLVVGLALLLQIAFPLAGEGAAEPKGQMILAVDVTIASSWFDPGDAPAIGGGHT
jgi:hypothetical protein